MLRELPAFHIGQQSRAEQKFTYYCIGAGSAELLPEWATWDDLFNPSFWVHHSKFLRVDDLVRIRARDGAFDCTLRVASVPKGGVVMEVWPIFPKGVGAIEAAVGADAKRPRIVPITSGGKVAVRIEPLGSKFRVIALDQNVHSDNHDTKAEAESVMAKYLSELRLRLPTAEEEAVGVEAALKAEEERKARRAPPKRDAKK